MNINSLSTIYIIRKLDENDIEQIYSLSSSNEIFYKYHPPFVTKESILEDMKALPPGKDYKDKYYIGFFNNKDLVAIMDLILGFPKKDIAYLGLFMMNKKYQNKNIGSNIINDVKAYLKSIGFKKIRLAVDKNNPQSNHFWSKNGFKRIDENNYIIMDFNL